MQVNIVFILTHMQFLTNKRNLIKYKLTEQESTELYENHLYNL